MAEPALQLLLQEEDFNVSISPDDKNLRYSGHDKKEKVMLQSQISAKPMCRVNDWLRSFGLKSRNEMPTFCHESFIHHGYRPNPSSAWYCIQSIFHPTNETLNVWTHAIPGMLVAWSCYCFLQENVTDRSYCSPLLWPYCFFVFGTIITFFGSSCAHAFNCISAGVREACFCCDYGLIAVQALGVTCSFTFYICPFICIVQIQGLHLVWYISILLGINLAVAAACCTRYPGVPHRHLLRVTPFAIMYILLSFSCAHKYSGDDLMESTKRLNVSNALHPPSCGLMRTPEAGADFRKLCLVMLIGAIIQALKFPERLKPGMFDIVGHSHQIFHLFMAYGMYLQSVFIQHALKEILMLNIFEQMTAADLGITPLTGMAIPLASVLLSGAISFHYSNDLCRRCDTTPIRQQHGSGHSKQD